MRNRTERQTRRIHFNVREVEQFLTCQDKNIYIHIYTYEGHFLIYKNFGGIFNFFYQDIFEGEVMNTVTLLD